MNALVKKYQELKVSQDRLIRVYQSRGKWSKAEQVRYLDLSRQIAAVMGAFDDATHEEVFGAKPIKGGPR
jgi:hypothetical protein